MNKEDAVIGARVVYYDNTNSGTIVGLSKISEDVVAVEWSSGQINATHINDLELEFQINSIVYQKIDEVLSEAYDKVLAAKIYAKEQHLSLREMQDRNLIENFAALVDEIDEANAWVSSSHNC